MATGTGSPMATGTCWQLMTGPGEIPRCRKPLTWQPAGYPELLLLILIRLAVGLRWRQLTALLLGRPAEGLGG